MRTLDRSRPGIAAQAVGIAQGALEVAAEYAHERKQFGKPIADFQMIQAMLADMDAGTEAARQLLYKACTEIEAGAPDAARWSAMCKLVAGDTAMRVTTDAVQVLGGYGYIDEFPVERMMRDAKITQLYEGTQQIQRLVIARALFGAAARDAANRRQTRSPRPCSIVVLASRFPTPPPAASASARRASRSGGDAPPW